MIFPKHGYKLPYTKWEAYERWLQDIVHAGLNGNYRVYSNLLHRLFVTPYIPAITADKNRVGDGVNMRYVYGSSGDLYKKFMRKEIPEQMPARDPQFFEDTKDRYCSMLEMMIGLAERINNTYFDSDSDRTYMWFWNMVDNLGLKPYTDDVFDGQQSDNDVDTIINVFLHNTYDEETGKGSLFPNKWAETRPKTLDIFRQMENYYIIEYELLDPLTEEEFDKNYLISF